MPGRSAKSSVDLTQFHSVLICTGVDKKYCAILSAVQLLVSKTYIPHGCQKHTFPMDAILRNILFRM